MQDREVMQMALDALVDALDSQQEELNEHINKYGEWYRPKRVEYMKQAIENTKTARDALRAALARPEQEPVAWMCPDDPERETAFSWQSGHCNDCGKQRVPVYTAPSQHEWQGLTVEEAVAIYKTIQAESSELEFAKAIEAKLKEKNT